jgi:cellulose synthase (UDP-forming)
MMRVESCDNSAVVGLKYEIRTAADYLALADLIYGDADALAKFLTARRRRMGIVRGTLMFLRWAITEPFRAFHYLLVGWRPKMAGDDEPADEGASAHYGAAADRGQPIPASAGGVARIASPSVVPDRAERRAAAGGAAEPLAGFGFVDPAPLLGS